MNKENITPLVIGVVAGIIVMFFVQFGTKLVDQRTRVSQIESAVANNSATIAQVVSFIQQSQGGQQPATGTPEAK